VDLKFYYDTVYRDSFFYNSDLDTWDLVLQQQLQIGNRQDLTYGFRYRYADSDLTGKTNLRLRQNSRSDYLYSFFIQDDISLVNNRLILTLGSKFEDQSLSDFEILPTARLLWKASANTSLWASVSRAVRSPSIGEQDIAVEAGYRPINGDPTQLMGLWVLGNPDLEAEQSIAYEAGYRARITPRASVDLSLMLRVIATHRNNSQLVTRHSLSLLPCKINQLPGFP
jgi:iron complex outermembrane receptor protein